MPADPRPVLKLERTIARSPAEVWGIMTNWGLSELWLGLARMRPMHPKEPLKKGSLLIYQTRGRDHSMLITQFKPGKRLSLSARQGGVTATYAYGLWRVPQGTRVTLEATCEADGIWAMLLPLSNWMMRRSDGDQLVALARLVEVTTGGSSAKPP